MKLYREALRERSPSGLDLGGPPVHTGGVDRAAEHLYLHYVSRRAPKRRNTVSRAALEALVRERLEHGRRAASLLEHLAKAPEPDAFTISFDDAHASVLAHAAPVLAELGVSATLFVPTAFVDTSDDFLGWDGLRRLRDAGWTLGSHGHGHPRMGWRLYDEDEHAHQARLERDLARSREVMERELGEAPRLFAYPFGEDPEVARRAVRATGFAAAFTVRGTLDWTGELLSIPRVAVESDEGPDIAPGDAPSRISVIVPAFDRVHILSDVVTRLASQTYPEDHYEVVVVDDGSRDDPGPIFDEMPDNVRLVRQGDAEFRAGQARQRGADEARFEVLAFLDADVAVEPDFLWHLDWVHRRVPDAVLLGALSGYNLHDLGFLHTPDAVFGAELAGLPIIPDRSREPTLRSCLDNLDWLADPWPLTYTGNLSLSKALFERVGGFADEFVGWGLEDVDLGIRLHRAGGRFVFSRFAIGWHIVDPRETGWRNPFREERPTRERFEGYLTNLEILRRRHAADAAVEVYVERSLRDIEETCGRPMTVGIELGGAARTRTPLHRRLHRVQPGGVPGDELLDRVEYAKKIGARTIYLLGGAPAEHPDFLEVLRAASAAVGWVSMETLVYPFATPGLAAAARAAGLRGVVAEVHAFERGPYETLHGAGTFDAFMDGLAALSATDLERRAHLVVSEGTVELLDATLAELARRELPIEEATVTAPALAAVVRARTGRDPRVV